MSIADKVIYPIYATSDADPASQERSMSDFAGYGASCLRVSDVISDVVDDVLETYTETKHDSGRQWHEAGSWLMPGEAIVVVDLATLRAIEDKQ